MKPGKKSLILGAALIALTTAGPRIYNKITQGEERLLTPTQEEVVPDGEYLTPDKETKVEGQFLTPFSVRAKNLQHNLEALTKEGFTPHYQAIQLNEEETLYRVFVETTDCSLAQDAAHLYELKDVLGFDHVARLTYNNGTLEKWNKQHSIKYEASDRAKYSSDIPYIDTFEKYAGISGIDLDYLLALAYQESKLDPNAKSHTGATGLMQLIRATAKEHNVTERKNPTQSIRGGAEHIAEIAPMFAHDPYLTSAGYNSGHNGMKRKLTNGNCTYEDVENNVRKETKMYTPLVTEFFIKLENDDHITFSEFKKKYKNTYKEVSKRF